MLQPFVGPESSAMLRRVRHWDSPISGQFCLQRVFSSHLENLVFSSDALLSFDSVFELIHYFFSSCTNVEHFVTFVHIDHL